MVPPPDTMGEFPDFDSMTPAEQMAWLESLAKRQGAREDELTTSADMEIAEVSADAVIDEPGYVPFEGSRTARRMKEEAEAAAQAPPPEPEPEAVSEIDWGMPEETLEEDLADLFGAMASEADAEDPMQWLDGLSAEPDAIPSDLEGLFGDADAAWEDSGATTPLEPELAADRTISDDSLGDMDDPMLFLESLARRQGVDPNELTTSADMNVAEVSTDTVIDEPGYVPFEGSRSARRLKEEAEALSMADAEPVEETQPEEPVMISEPSEAVVSGELFAAAEEEDAGLYEAESGDDSLSWLEDLAAEPDEEFSDMFAEFEEPETAAPAASSDDPLAGLSDEDVAWLQAQGQLTPYQELAWLKRQAAKLAEVHHELDEDVTVDEDVAPAEPADLPPWLAEMRSTSEHEEAELPVGLFDEIEPETELDMSSLALATDELSPAEVDSLWAEPVEEVLEFDEVPESELAAFLEGNLEPEADPLAEALDAEYERKAVGDDTEPAWYTDAVAKVASEAPAVPEELASVYGETADDYEAPAEPVVSAAVPVEMPDWLKEVREEAPVPDWLEGDEAAVSPAPAGDIPDWLQEQMPTTEAESGIPDWLSDMGEEELLEEAAFDWIPREAPATEPESAPVETAPPPAPEPVAEIIPEPEPARVSPPVAAPSAGEPEVSTPTPAAVPQGAQYEQYRQRLATHPNDYANRLGLARTLRDQRQTDPSLDQYETLIIASQQLQDVVNDLRDLVNDASEPRAHRLLGDAYMRQGRLQEALTAYRSALNKL